MTADAPTNAQMIAELRMATIAILTGLPFTPVTPREGQVACFPPNSAAVPNDAAATLLGGCDG